MAEKTFSNVRLGLKIDSLSNWQNSNLVLRPGEVAFATVAASAGLGLSEPVIMAKIGTQDSFEANKTFKDLDWAFHAKASDVLSYCKNADEFAAKIQELIDGADFDNNADFKALVARVAAAESDIDILQSEMEAVEKQAADNAGAIAELQVALGEDGSVAEQIAAAIAALDLANTYDAKGAAAAAQTAAEKKATDLNTAMNTRVEALEAIDHDHSNKTVLDGITSTKVSAWDTAATNNHTHSNKTVLDGITSTKVSAWDAAEQNAKDYADDLDEAMDVRVKALEAIDHEHANKAELDKIATGDKAKWDAMEQNANDYADGLNTAMDARVKVVEGKVDTTGTVNEAITAAVAAEAQLRESADTALGNRVKTIEDDYLKAADKTALQGNIDALANGAVAANTEAIEKLNGDDTVVGSVDYKVAQEVAKILNDNDTSDIDTLEEIAAWIKNDTAGVGALNQQVQQNKTDIATLNGTGAGSVSKQISDAIAAENLAQYATDTEMTAATGRISTAEGKITALEGKMTTAEGEIDALQDKVDTTGTVNEAITAAIEALKIGDYAKAADLTAAVNRITTAEGDIDALEGRMTTAEGEIDALQTEVAKKANDSALAAIAKTGNVNDLIQTSGDVIILDCGTSV